jgi:hypothetical protein
MYAAPSGADPISECPQVQRTTYPSRNLARDARGSRRDRGDEFRANLAASGRQASHQRSDATALGKRVRSVPPDASATGKE